MHCVLFMLKAPLWLPLALEYDSKPHSGGPVQHRISSITTSSFFDCSSSNVLHPPALDMLWEEGNLTLSWLSCAHPFLASSCCYFFLCIFTLQWPWHLLFRGQTSGAEAYVTL